MEMLQVTELIASLGFPIFVAVWMLWRADKTEKRTQEILAELTLSINKLCMWMGEDK